MEIIRNMVRSACRHYATIRSHARIHPDATIGFRACLQNILGEQDSICIGAFSTINGRLLTYGHGGSISIGEYCFVGPRTELWSMNSISIGNRVLISHDVNIHDGTGHSINAVERHRHYKQIITSGHPRSIVELPGLNSGPIIIEDDVWISFGVIVLQGVTIGRGSVIAAGSIVVQDVPPESFYYCEATPKVRPLTESS